MPGRGDKMGRTSFSGPAKGAYATLLVDIVGSSETPGAVTITKRVQLPYACKVMEVGIACQSSAGGASRPTIQITDGTNNLLSGAVSVVTAGAVAVTPTSTPSLVAAQRSRAKGDILQVQTTWVATEATVGLTAAITVAVTGHVVADARND